MKIVFLGTSSTYPTKKRNHPSLHVSFLTEKMLFDCGEGTQRQMRLAKISPTKLTRIFITHWHGDHALGLGGIIQSLCMSQRKAPLYIYGPKDTKKRMNHLLNTFAFVLSFPLKIKEVEEGEVFSDKNMSVYSTKVKHRTPCVAYYLKEKDRRKMNMKYLAKFGLKQHKVLGQLQKGKDIVWRGKKISAEKATIILPGRKLTYVTDTAYLEKLETFSENSSILVCEATFGDDIYEKAKEYAHLTATESAKLAKESKSKQLILTHFSQRYRDLKPLLKQAKKIFKNTTLAEDFMTLEIK